MRSVTEGTRDIRVAGAGRLLGAVHTARTIHPAGRSGR